MIMIHANHDAKQAGCQCLSNPAGVNCNVHPICKCCIFRDEKLQWIKKIKHSAIAFIYSRRTSHCNPVHFMKQARLCDSLQQGNGIKTAGRKEKKTLWESTTWTCADAFLLIPKKTQWRGCCFYVSVAHKGLGKAWENVVCAMYHQQSYFHSNSSQISIQTQYGHVNYE